MRLNKTFFALMISIAPLSAHAEWVDGATLKDSLASLIDMAMGTPSLEGNGIVYKLSAAKACKLFDDVTLSDSDAAADAKCVSHAQKFSVVQEIYVDHATNGEGKLTFKYNNYSMFSVIYRPNSLQLDVSFGNFGHGVHALYDTKEMDYATEAQPFIPSSGSMRILMDSTVANKTSVKVSFPDGIDHSIADASSGLGSDVRLAADEGGSVELITQPGSKVVKTVLNLKDFAIQIPGYIDTYVYSAGTAELHQADEISGTVQYDWNADIYSAQNLLIDNYSLAMDAVTGLTINTPSAMSFSWDQNNFSYTSSSAMDLTVHADTSLAGGIVQAGDYQLKNDASGSFSTNLVDSFEVSIANLVVKVPSDFFANAGLSNMFPAGEAVHLAVDGLSGELSYSTATNVDVEMDSIVVDGLELKSNAAVLVSADMSSGSLDGAFSSNLSDTGSVSLGAVNFAAVVNDGLGFNLPTGNYSLTSDAGMSIIAAPSAGGVTHATYLVNNFSLVVPSMYDVAATGMNGSADVNPTSITSSVIELSGVLGSGHATIGTDDFGVWSQVGASNLHIDPSSSPTMVTSSAATTINYAFSNTIMGGPGSAEVVLDAGTTVSGVDVTSGSVAVTLLGDPFDDLFAAGGMLEGLHFIDNGGTGTLVHP